MHKHPPATTQLVSHWGGHLLRRQEFKINGIWGGDSENFQFPQQMKKLEINSSDTPRGWLRKLELPRSSDKLCRKSTKMAQGRLIEEWPGPTGRTWALEVLNPTGPHTSWNEMQCTSLSKTQCPHLDKANGDGHLAELIWILKILYKPLIWRLIRALPVAQW